MKTAHNRAKAYQNALLVFLLACFSQYAHAGAKLLGIDTEYRSGSVVVKLRMDSPAPIPSAFVLENPARLVVDLFDTQSNVEQAEIAINAYGLKTIQTTESDQRTRVLFSLNETMPYDLRSEGNAIIILLRENHSSPTNVPNEALAAITGINFRRTADGGGRMLITLEDPHMTVSVREDNQKIILTFPDARVLPELAHTLDVVDFATPVETIEIIGRSRRVQITVFLGSAAFDSASWQSGNQFVLDVRNKTASGSKNKKKSSEYSGQKLSLNFQDVPVRSVLQILAEFTHLNFVASDSVQGNISLRLNNVPWDQALELVMKAKGLAKHQEGNIIQIAPLSEINQLEKSFLEAQNSLDDIEPLQTDIIQINYTRAEDIKTVLLGTTDKVAIVAPENDLPEQTLITVPPAPNKPHKAETSPMLLSGRGNITIDSRTNQLILFETAKNIQKIKALIKKLDIPVKQVLIESRIVIASNDFTRELGVRLASNQIPSISSITTPTTTTTTSTGTSASWNALVDLGSQLAAVSGGQFGFTLLKAGDYLLDLELSAAQIEGRGEIVSNPRLITSDQTRAVIKQGVQIPYQSAASGTGTIIPNTVFKEAVLELNVTPHITPEDTIMMELLIKKDSPGLPTPTGQIEIERREISTTALVDNGETVVLGGVYEGTKNNVTDKVPFLGDLPGLGFLFRRNRVDDNKKELLIFITPKILKQQDALRR